VTLMEEELATQPGCWRAAVAVAADEAGRMPRRDERVAAVGCGTSLYMARAYALLRESAGHGETDAFPASEFPRSRRYDRVVALSRSGTTTEVVNLLAGLPEDTPSLAFTAAADSPIADVATDTLVLDVAAERAVVQTRFPTSVLALLRASLGEELDGVIADGQEALAAPLPVGAEATQITFLGSGWAGAIAEEAALKCRESAGAWTEAYPAMEYRHGPISVSGPGTVVWVFGACPEGLEDDAAATGATVVTSTLDPMADLIRAQRLAVALAQQAGRDPDRPWHLSFSIILN
jgi:fructoselysine-6-P-deglycase FrlB-like protein